MNLLVTNVIKPVSAVVGPRNTNVQSVYKIRHVQATESVSVTKTGAELTAATILVIVIVNVFTDAMGLNHRIACSVLKTRIKISRLDACALKIGVGLTAPSILGDVLCDVQSAKERTIATVRNVFLTQLCTQMECAIAICSTKVTFVRNMST